TAAQFAEIRDGRVTFRWEAVPLADRPTLDRMAATIRAASGPGRVLAARGWLRAGPPRTRRRPPVAGSGRSLARRSGPNDRRGTVRPAVRGFRPRSLRRAAVRRTEPVHRGLPVVRPGPAPDGGPAP